MKTTLLNHQVIGTSWMLGREFCEEGPWGGILGDEMGMGKTLQALGCIVSNRPGRKDLKTHSKTTLIVAPATAIEQWKDEIQKHTDRKYIGTVFHFKQSANLELETLKTFGIILASYQEVSSQFPSKKLRAQLQNDGGSVEEWKERFDDNLGLLFKIPFWRVILDEAHHIKNKDSQMSVACQNLPGRHRWGMSGTPITNCLDELYPYFKFLKADWAGDLRDFHYLYGNSADQTMATTFMGRPLYDIPMCHMSVRRVQLTKEERVIYNVVESRFIEIINKILEKLRKSGRRVRLRDLEIYIVFLLRLRQGAAHPILLEPVFKNTLRKYDLLEIKRRLREVDIAIASKNEDVCRLCYQELIDGYIAKCEHLFCKECLDDHILEERRGGRVIPKCPDCNKSLTEYEPLEQSDAEDSDIEGSVKTSGSRRAIPQVRKLGRDSFKKHPKFRKSHSRFLQECDQAYPKPAVPSAKTIAVREAIIKWQSEAPDDKIIVFVEFKMTGAILGRMLEAEGIEFLYFFGDMTSAEKQNAIRGFHNKKNIKVASFRCGSVALNLTCANRVILVDLWWNISIELQAFARVFRIGQTKETYFLRIIAHNTIDDRIEALQEEKIKNINTVLGPGEKSKLSTEEVAALFGHLKKFDDGSFEIVPDNEGDAELNEEFDEIEEAEEAEEI
ncbi:P-loop containing nucleoside triphosphate hydrolase protein [Xylaria longipes]|nr:P-loop containing nucleoside triphosphate hydrolase protein [Xylaria longipes]